MNYLRAVFTLTVIAWIGVGSAQGAENASPPAIAPPRAREELVARVQITQRAGQKAVFSIGERAKEIAQVAAEVEQAKASRKGAVAVCELVVAEEVSYDALMAAFAAASPANIDVVRITVGKNQFDIPLVRMMKPSEVKIGINLKSVEGKIQPTVAGKEVKDVAEAAERLKERKKSENISVMLGADGATRAEDVIIYAKAAQSVGVTVTLLSSGKAPPAEAVDMIALGSGGEEGRSPATEVRGIGAKFYGCRMTGKKVVYVVDCSAGVAKNFDALKEELIRSVNNQIPVQSFNAIVISDKNESLYAGLQRATPETKKEFAMKMSNVKAAGEITGKLEPFKEALEKAFAMKPDAIFFLGGSGLDERLIASVKEMNKDKKVRVHTLGFVTKDHTRDQTLMEIAKDSGGMFKFVSSEELEK